MPAEDKVHQPVRNALIKEGWTITAEPYLIDVEGEFLYADIGAERILEDKKVQAIIVEVKSFRERSLIHALEEAWGQYQIYRRILSVLKPDYKVYLALPQVAYERLQKRRTFNILMQFKEVSLIVVNIDEEKIVLWIE